MESLVARILELSCHDPALPVDVVDLGDPETIQSNRLTTKYAITDSRLNSSYNNSNGYSVVGGGLVGNGSKPYQEKKQPCCV